MGIAYMIIDATTGAGFYAAITAAAITVIAAIREGWLLIVKKETDKRCLVFFCTIMIAWMIPIIGYLRAPG